MSIAVVDRIWKQSKHKGTALLVLLAIASEATDDGVARPSMKDLAARTKLSERGVQYIIARLERSQELTVERKAGGCNLFRVQTVRGANVAPVQHECTPPPQTVHPSPRKEKERTKEKEKSKNTGTGKGNSHAERVSDGRHAGFIQWLFHQHPKIKILPQHFKALKTLLDGYPHMSLDEIREYWARFRASPNPYDRQQGLSLGYFCREINRFTEEMTDGRPDSRETKSERNERLTREAGEDILRRSTEKTGGSLRSVGFGSTAGGLPRSS